MSPTGNDEKQRLKYTSVHSVSMRYIAAAVTAIPVGLIIWLELLYLVFGITGYDATPIINIMTFVLAFGLAYGWPLYRTQRPAEVAQRGCRIGIAVALLFPVVAVFVILLWEGASSRRDLGMGGMALYAIPLVTAVLALVFTVIFSIANWFLSRRLKKETYKQTVHKSPN